MNREIKFRVWDEKFNCWDNCSDGGHYLLIPKINIVAQGRIFQQFTGLKDINGREIYEGDIIYAHLNDSKYIVKFGQHTLSDEYDGTDCCGFYLDRIASSSYTAESIGKTSKHNLKIIGNIFENPELLENAR
jgi:uncharacterized phage protein (TIGR01671 family)